MGSSPYKTASVVSFLWVFMSVHRVCWVVCLVLGVVSAAAARAESWCSEPIYAHEWGVMVFNGAGEGVSGLIPLPSWIEQRGGTSGDLAHRKILTPVRALPPDNGTRDLPVLQFYAPRLWSEVVPIGVEVGFTQGVASAWFPPVNGLRSASEANSPGAQAAREKLLKARAARDPHGLGGDPVPSDPTRQLIWEELTLRKIPTKLSPEPFEQPWVQTLRAIPDALSVSTAGQVEQFVFYEGRTAERPALNLTSSGAGGACACEVENTGKHAAHDVFVIARDPSGAVRVGFVDTIQAGKHGSVTLDSLDPKTARATLDSRLVAALTSSGHNADGTPAPKIEPGCIMGRDPRHPHRNFRKPHPVRTRGPSHRVDLGGSHVRAARIDADL